MGNEMKGWLFKAPALLLLIASFFGSIYAAIKHIAGVRSTVPVVIFIILLCYFVGEFYHRKLF